MAALKNMQVHHIEKLLLLYPLGIIIKFETSLKLWQNKLPENVINSLTNISDSSITSALPLSVPQSKTSFCLETVFEENNQCAYVIDYFHQHNCLNDSCRSIIVTAIINHIIKAKISMSMTLANVIGDTVVAKFPTELKVRVFNSIKYMTNYETILYSLFYFRTYTSLKIPLIKLLKGKFILSTSIPSNNYKTMV